MKKISRKVNELKEKLGSEIIGGAYQPMTRLPSERMMCDLYDVSRTTVRQALKELATDGILRPSGRRGVVVAPDALEQVRTIVPGSQLRAVFFFFPNQLGNPLLQNIFQSCLHASGTSVQCVACFEERLTVESLLQQKPDAVIFFSHPGEVFLRELSRKVPAIYLINCTDPAFSYLAPDNYKGGRLMAQCLLENGHREIGSIRARGGNRDSEFALRVEGCYECLTDACVSPDTAFVAGEDLFKTLDLCANALDFLLEKNPRLSAVFVPSDIMALGVYSGLFRRNLVPGRDVSVIAFDDQFFAPHIQPGLTTVKYPSEAIGVKLAEVLQQLLRSGKAPIQQTIAPVLIKRESVADLRV